MLSFLVRLALLFLILYLIRITLRNFFQNVSSRQTSPRSRKRQEIRGIMMKDPVCGIYVDVNSALISKRNGKDFYFCSEDCRKKFGMIG
ncbi:MAG: YHS domain-containing protein [Acidobacteria bacterium]|nr:YHS domain-containing protein [Acidobacteriota bacterium]